MQFDCSKYVKILLFLFIPLYLYSLWGRVPDIDDGWIGELAFWLNKDGQMRSELMRGITSLEDKFVVNDKLFVLNGALFIRIFGFSLYSLKSVSLVWYILFLILFWHYTTRLKKIFNKNDLLFAMLFLFSFPWIFKYSFVFRPEVMMMTLGFAGYVLLEKYIDAARGKYKAIFISGLLFGLAMAAHLNGIIMVLASVGLLAWNKKYFAVIPFGMAVLLGFSVYFYDMTTAADFALWQHQFFDSPSLDSLDKSATWLKPVLNLLDEHMRYFHNVKIIVFSVFMLVSLIAGFKFLYRHHTNLIRFAILVAILTGLIAMHKSRQYILINFPYLLILITLTFKAVKERKITRFAIGNPPVIKSFLIFLFFVYLITSIFFDTQLSLEKFSPEQNRKRALKYARTGEKSMNIVAPMTFIFNEIEHFNRIQGDLCYVELQKTDPDIFGEGFLKKAESFNIELIMISPVYQPVLGINHLHKGDVAGNYQVIDKTEYALVFKRLH